MTGKEPDAADTKAASGEPDLLHVNRLIEGQELADYLGVPYGTLNAWATRGGGPDFVKVGIHRKYRPEAVRAWLDAGTNVKRPRSVA